jgi:RNA recognition motif-containing protein
MTIRVANLPSQSTEQDIKNLFAEHGEVLIIEFLEDRADIELENQEIESSVIEKLNGKVFQGNTLSVVGIEGDRGIRRERHGSGGQRKR